MDIFEYKGKKYISINGKDYFLIRAYQKGYGKLIFVQVTGMTPLHKEDLPNNEWNVLRTKSGKKLVWTAYNKKYFKYDTDRENPCLAFLGATTRTSYFIALRLIARKFNLNLQDEDIEKITDCYIAGKKHNSSINEQDDSGNSGQSIVIVDFTYLSQKNAETMFKGGAEP